MTDWLFDKPLGWSDGLSMKSYNDAVELALRVNADFFDALTRRGQRGAVLLKTLNPTEYERLFGGGVQSGQSSTSYRKPR